MIFSTIVFSTTIVWSFLDPCTPSVVLFADVVGIGAAVFFTVEFLPQIVTTVREKVWEGELLLTAAAQWRDLLYLVYDSMRRCTCRRILSSLWRSRKMVGNVNCVRMMAQEHMAAHFGQRIGAARCAHPLRILRPQEGSLSKVGSCGVRR
jgi:hypothetical protein